MNESWFTHPDELLKLMKGAPELANGFSDWRLAVSDDEPGLLAEIVTSLQGKMPAILVINSGDHWVVIVGVEIDDVTSAVVRMMVLDPLPQNNGRVSHTYIDDCKQEGLTYVVAVSGPNEVALGGLHLPINDTPSPPGLNHYVDKYVALVYGPGWNHKLAQKLRQLRRLPLPPYVWQPNAPLTATVPGTSVDAMRQALNARAQLWEITWLRDLLNSPHEHVARIVYDVRQKLEPYHLLSLFSPTLGYGVIGAFTVQDNQPLHFRFTRIRKFSESLKLHTEQPLWWTVDWMPELKSPYFPFARQVVNNKHQYRRLFDDYTFELDMSHGV
jgi:hypothetical protein